jgi:hypothetical protein
MKLHSFERYRASAAERRRHGGNIVTKYLVRGAGSCTFYVWAYGKTQHDRKRYAQAKAETIVKEGKENDFSLPHYAAR